MDVNYFYDLKIRLDQLQVYWEQEIDVFVNVYFDLVMKLNYFKQQKYLYFFMDFVVDCFRVIEEEDK